MSPAKRTPVHVLKRGDTDHKGRTVGPKLLEIGFTGKIAELPADTRNPRTILAQAIVDPKNPLTARVMVNRIWQWHFGTGIVNTANDFGVNGGRPSHPELLDWLASEFIAGGWHIKHIHRLIVLSSTYRQSSSLKGGRPTQALLVIHVRADPDDRLLWRFPRRRLTAEEIRDAMLSVAGPLEPQSGRAERRCSSRWRSGETAIHAVAVDGHSRSLGTRSTVGLLARQAELCGCRSCRRSISRMRRRAVPRRESSTHALQALELLNGTLANDLADSFAERLRREAGSDPQALITRAYRLAVGRSPTVRETGVGSRIPEDAAAARVRPCDVQPECVPVRELDRMYTEQRIYSARRS